MPEAAHTDYGYFFAWAGPPMIKRGIGRNSRAKQWRRGIKLDVVGDSNYEILSDDNVGGIAVEAQMEELKKNDGNHRT